MRYSTGSRRTSRGVTAMAELTLDEAIYQALGVLALSHYCTEDEMYNSAYVGLAEAYGISGVMVASFDEEALNKGVIKRK